MCLQRLLQYYYYHNTLLSAVDLRDTKLRLANNQYDHHHQVCASPNHHPMNVFCGNKCRSKNAEGYVNNICRDLMRPASTYAVKLPSPALSPMRRQTNFN